MTEAAIAIVWDDSATDAGKKLGLEIKAKLKGRAPHAVLVFASSRYNYEELLTALDLECSPEFMVGCSSAGEFTKEERKEGAVCAVGLWSDRLKFAAGVGKNIRSSQSSAAEEMVSSFKGLHSHDHKYHTAIVMSDALAGYTDDFIQELTLKTGGKYQLVGGGAGDDAKFHETEVFFGKKSYKDAAVALEIVSNEPIGIGVQHGWEASSRAMRGKRPISPFCASGIRGLG